MFGDVGQARTKARICRTVDCYNFKTHLHKNRQLVSFAGLAPVQKSSGTYIKGCPMISRLGGKELRDVLYTCLPAGRCVP